jgi:hypothetical protein
MDGPEGMVDRPSERPSVGRRLAAAGALCALLAAVGVVIGSLLRDPARMLAVLLLTVGAVVAAWTALVHRGARRVAATVVAGSAVAASPRSSWTAATTCGHWPKERSPTAPT